MPELTATLTAKRESEHENRRFLAAIQGIDLDEELGTKTDAFEEVRQRAMKRVVGENAQIADPDDIISLQGAAARTAGFGIGNGLAYEVVK